MSGSVLYQYAIFHDLNNRNH